MKVHFNYQTLPQDVISQETVLKQLKERKLLKDYTIKEEKQQDDS